jgi:hypothetical protein
MGASWSLARAALDRFIVSIFCNAGNCELPLYNGKRVLSTHSMIWFRCGTWLSIVELSPVPVTRGQPGAVSAASGSGPLAGAVTIEYSSSHGRDSLSTLIQRSSVDLSTMAAAHASSQHR